MKYSEKSWGRFKIWLKSDYFLVPFSIFYITRVVLFIVAYIAEIGIPTPEAEGLWHWRPENIFLDVWGRWDAGWYFDIAQNGYFYTPDAQNSTAFFPLYPLIVRLVSILFFGNLFLSGILVSNLCFLAALILLYRLTESEFEDREIAYRTTLYIAIFPTAFYFSAFYTESLFLLITVAAFYFARRKLWLEAALMGILASMTRVQGILIWLPVMVEWLQSKGWSFSGMFAKQTWNDTLRGLRTDWKNFLFINMIPLGLISFIIFLGIVFGEPLAFYKSQEHWSQQAMNPITSFWGAITELNIIDIASGRVSVHMLLAIASTIFLFALLPVVWKLLGDTYGIYVLISLLVGFSVSSNPALARHTLVVFPVFMALGKLGEKPKVDLTISFSSIALLGVLTAMFVNWILVN